MMKVRFRNLTESEEKCFKEISKEIDFLGEQSVEIEIKQENEKGFSFHYENRILKISYGRRKEFCRALLFLAGLSQIEEDFSYSESSCLDDCGLMADVSRNAVLKKKTVKKLVRIAACLGYDFVGLYMEDTLRVDNEPYMGYMRGSMSKEELRELSEYAELFDMELRPYIQTLAHFNQITRYETYQDFVDCNDILLAKDERTKEFIENIFKTISECFISQNVNIGMDEADMIGLGKYLQKHGFENRSEIMQEHLNMVMGIAKKYGFKLQMWSDMFYKLASGGKYYVDDNQELDEISVPDNLKIFYWDYYSTESEHYRKMLQSHKKLTPNVGFAGGNWKWTGFAPNNRFSIKAGKAAIEAIRSEDIKDVVFTCWGDDGGEASIFSLFPSFFKNSNLLYGSQMTEESFKALTGGSIEDFLAMDDCNPRMEDGKHHNNASKWLLYNDPLIGTFNSVVWNNVEEYYTTVAKTLEKACKNRKYGYLFETLFWLCKVLEHKAELGRVIRDAYQSDDRKKLEDVGQNVIPRILSELESFYTVFSNQWHLENKSFGFEVQTIRIGGLKQRLEDVQKIIENYLNGKISVIEELEEKEQPFAYFKNDTLDDLSYNLWVNIASPSRL